jgi:hypothetical protein
MNEYAKQANSQRKSKIASYVRNDPHERTDASGYEPSGAQNGDVQTGMRVLSRRQYAGGGQVNGSMSCAHAGRKPRATGGKAIADALVNRDDREANKSRDGIKFVGGFMAGGRAHKAVGGSMGLQPVPRASGGGSWKKGVNAYTDSNGNKPFSRSVGQVKKDYGVDMGGRPDRYVDVVPKPTESPGMTAAKKRASGGAAHGAGCGCSMCSGGRAKRASGGGNWIAGAIKHKGALHKELGVPAGEKIPEKKLDKAAKMGGKEGARARLAKTLEGFHKADGGVIDGGTRPKGGRMARKGGGRTKKGMNVNIIIAPSQPSPRPMMPPQGGPPMPPGAGPMGLHAGAPPPVGPPPQMPPAGAGMPRKDGGSVVGKFAKPGRYPIKNASGGAKGRLEKIRAYG